jgi:predicted membrane-bound spermidine synthase
MKNLKIYVRGILKFAGLSQFWYVESCLRKSDLSLRNAVNILVIPM